VVRKFGRRVGWFAQAGSQALGEVRIEGYVVRYYDPFSTGKGDEFCSAEAVNGEQFPFAAGAAAL
jgi:hypothetical protein